MKRALLCLPFLLTGLAAVAFASPDPRNFDHGRLIPDESYCDQPFIVITRDGNGSAP